MGKNRHKHRLLNRQGLCGQLDFSPVQMLQLAHIVKEFKQNIDRKSYSSVPYQSNYSTLSTHYKPLDSMCYKPITKEEIEVLDDKLQRLDAFLRKQEQIIEDIARNGIKALPESKPTTVVVATTPSNSSESSPIQESDEMIWGC